MTETHRATHPLLALATHTPHPRHEVGATAQPRCAPSARDRLLPQSRRSAGPARGHDIVERRGVATLAISASPSDTPTASPAQSAPSIPHSGTKEYLPCTWNRALESPGRALTSAN